MQENDYYILLNQYDNFRIKDKNNKDDNIHKSEALKR